MQPPDLLWIVTTQWRAQALGYAGDPNARTPHLDRLAAESVNFAQAVTPHPFGPWARAALLTGLPSPANGVRDYYDPLPIGARTIAHVSGERGYATAFFGKWHLAKRDPRAALVGDAHARMIVPTEARGGFGFWEGFESGFQLNDPWLHGTRLPEPQRFSGYQSDVVARRAAEWMGGVVRREADRPAGPPPIGEATPLDAPWFAMVSLEAPHPPYEAPAGGVIARDPREIALAANVPRGGDIEAKARKELAGYYAHIEATDRAIGRLVATVDAESTRQGRRVPIVVFTSVHGDMHGAHGLFRKGWPHEESVRVPLLVRLPPELRGSASGVRSSALVSLLDLPRWASQWMDAPARAQLLPQPETEPPRISMPSVVALPHQCDRVWRGIRTATRKLIVDGSDEPWLYFDLEHDPLEQTNLVADATHRDELAELARRL